LYLIVMSPLSRKCPRQERGFVAGTTAQTQFLTCCRDRFNGGVDSVMQDVMFDTMAKILSIDSMECRLAALHGLSHLYHPATPQLLRQYTSIFRSLEGRCKEYPAEETEWRERVKAWRSRKRS
jgi:hypothetical protein